MDPRFKRADRTSSFNGLQSVPGVPLHSLGISPEKRHPKQTLRVVLTYTVRKLNDIASINHPKEKISKAIKACHHPSASSWKFNDRGRATLSGSKSKKRDPFFEMRTKENKVELDCLQRKSEIELEFWAPECEREVQGRQACLRTRPRSRGLGLRGRFVCHGVRTESNPFLPREGARGAWGVGVKAVVSLSLVWKAVRSPFEHILHCCDRATR